MMRIDDSSPPSAVCYDPPVLRTSHGAHTFVFIREEGLRGYFERMHIPSPQTDRRPRRSGAAGSLPAGMRPSYRRTVHAIEV